MSNLEVNPNKEYILAGDISASMDTKDPECGGMQRYEYMLEKFESFIKTAEDYDEHGAATVLLFGENVHVFADIKLEDIRAKLRRISFEGFTMTDQAIMTAYDLHLDRKREYKRDGKTHPGTHLIIFTDGAATNRMAVKRMIVDIANHVDSEDEFQITLLTVGSLDRNLRDFLENLHDELERELKRDYDIFHVDRLEDVNFLASIKGSLRHVD